MKRDIITQNENQSFIPSFHYEISHALLPCGHAFNGKKLTLGNLTLWGNLQLKMHLNMCEHCRQYAEQSAAIEIALRRQMENQEALETNLVGEPPALPEGFRNRIMERLDLESDSGL